MALVKWLPLESNPDVMNKFLKKLGIPSKWSIVDVISLDDELLPLVPKPVLAVMLLFPTGPKHSMNYWSADKMFTVLTSEAGQDELSKEQEKKMQTSGLTVSKSLYFMKQTIKNACGTVALIHSVANNTADLNLGTDSALLKFLNATKELSPEDRGKELETNRDIGSAHEASAHQGQTETPSVDDEINLHFITFVNVDGHLYELDGRKAIPIDHGSTSADTLLKDASVVCKEFMKRDPENVNFTILALVSSEK